MKAAARHVGIAIAGIVTGCALSLAASASRASTLPPGLPDLPDLGETMQRDNRSGFALSGFDPVAYFLNDAAVPGRPDSELIHDGAVWRFASAANRDAFAAAPQKYAPQYGGYCAFGVASGYKAPIEPDAWTVVDGKLYLNYNQSVRSRWSSDIPGFVRKAEANWPTVRAK